MARVNVDKMSLKQLVDLEAKLNSAIPAARERERAKVKQEMAVLAEKRGFSLRDLMGGYDNARVVHFFAMSFLVAFFVLHVVMVALVPRSLLLMIRGR